ncbi:hypothetical protein E3V36_07720 [Candidatus Marinimicrobia bacterium MT.SAG.2]|nr:hypothetical protein E3V36_07720 [Candidatus Marinimicrobia bacterium MT.SAG.2]
MYLYNLPPLEGGEEGTLYEDIRFQDQGVGIYRPITDETEANDFIYKYCTKISNGKATKEQIAEVSEYCVEGKVKDDRGREVFLKHKRIRESLEIKESTYSRRLRVMERNGFFKKYNYEFGK